MTEFFKTEKQLKKEKNSGIFLGFMITAVLAALLLIGGIVYWVIFVNKFTTWKDPAAGMSMKYPKQWQPIKTAQGTIIAFLSPKDNALDIFQENINIAKQDLSETPMLLDEFTTIATAQLETVFNNIEIVESRDTVIDYKRAHRLSFTAKAEQNMRVLLVWFMDGDNAYTITYMAIEEEYNKFLPMIEEMLSSFKFDKKF